MERNRLGECEEMAHCCRRVTHSAADCSCHQERSTETERGFLFRKGAFDEEGEWAWAWQRARGGEREAKRMGEGWAQDRKKGKLWREKEAYTMHNVDFQKETFWLTEGEEQQKSFGGKFGWPFYIIVIWDKRDMNMLMLITAIPHLLYSDRNLPPVLVSIAGSSPSILRCVWYSRKHDSFISLYHTHPKAAA